MSQFYDQASLVMVPSGYKAGKVYSQKPLSTDGELTFTRNSNATRVNADGLVEKVRTNLAAYSSDFTQQANPINITISANTTSDPFGTSLADSLLETVTNDAHAITYDYTVTSGAEVSFSIYAKSIGGRNIRLSGSTGWSSNIAMVDLSNGTLLSGSTADAKVTSVGNGWYRISITGTISGSTARVLIYSLNGSLTSFAGDVTKGVYLFGRQLEYGVPTDYIPTTSAAVSVGPTANVPRLNYSNGCPSLLLEPQRTNYHLYSENSAQWTQPADGLTIAYNTSETLDPSGYYGAEKVSSVSGNKRMFQLLSNPSGPLTISAFVKAGTADIFDFLTTSGSIFVEFNLTTLAINASSGTGTITSYGNGWYRLTASTSSAISNEVIQYRFLNDAGKYMYFWGAQAEAGAYATSYIPTLGASVTRLADACEKTGIASLFGSEFTLFVEGIRSDDTGPTRYIVAKGPTAGTYNDFISIERYADGLLCAVTNSSGTLLAQIAGGILSAGETFKVAMRCKSGDYALFLNGVKLGDNVVAHTPNSEKIYISYFDYYGKFSNKQTLILPSLTDAQAIELTTL